MVIGDPDKFAVIVSLVEDWNMEGEYKNGIIFFSVKGEIFPKEINTSILDSELFLLVEKRQKAENTTNASFLFDLDKKKLLEKLYCDDKNDGFKISTLTMEDIGYYFYAIPKDNLIRVVGGNITVNSNSNNYSNVVDVIIGKENYMRIEESLKLYYFDNILKST